MSEPLVAVVILNFNGKDLLQQFMPSVLQHSQNAEIWLADNGSTDDSVAFCKAQFPSVKTVSIAQNYGFAGGYNEALKKIKADYYVLLNSDVEAGPRWIKPVIDLMEGDKRIAACQPKILSWRQKDTFEYAGAAGGFIDKYGYPFCRGRLFNELEPDKGQYNDTREVFWATGACMFVRANVFRELNGFDASYFAHMEEIDLCWRMKNIGYKVMAVPTSEVYHLGAGTLKKLNPRKTFLNFRNNLVTLTKNYPNGNWFFVLLARLILDGIAGTKFLLEGKPMHMFAVVRGHLAYYFSLGSTLRKRKEMKARPNYKPVRSQFYEGNIVTKYFLKGVKKFSDLDPKDFSA